MAELGESCLFQNFGNFYIDLYWKYHNFERIGIHATVVLKWTDFSWSPETISTECINVHWSAAGMLWAVWAVKRTWDLPYIGKAARSHNMLVSYLIYTYFARLLTSLRGSLSHYTWSILKSVNLQYITLGCLDDGTNESSTKSLMFQVLFFIELGHSKLFNFIFVIL